MLQRAARLPARAHHTGHQGAVLKRFILRLLPNTMRVRARELRALAGPARRAYLARHLRGVVDSDDALPETPGRQPSMLFVCHGNIIRSALAEALYRRHAMAHFGDGVDVASAGVHATAGRSADPRAASAALTLAVDLTAHRAQPLTDALVARVDAIYVMDRLNEAEVCARFPRARRKVRRLGAFAPDPDLGDVIPDPYSLGADAVDSSAHRIDVAVRALVERVAARCRR